MTEISAHALEARLRIIEDKLAIYQLIASHPPSADTAHSDYTASVYLKEGVFDRGPDLEGAQGVAAIAAFTLKPAHEEAIQGGLAHFAGLPLIFLNGDSAVVTSYLLIIQLDKEGQHRTLANHGTSSGYRIHRAVVNHYCWVIRMRNDKISEIWGYYDAVKMAALFCDHHSQSAPGSGAAA